MFRFSPDSDDDIEAEEHKSGARSDNTNPVDRHEEKKIPGPIFGNSAVQEQPRNQMPQWGNNEEDELSDYVDENFEIDETDELWGLNEQMNKFRHFETKDNDIKKIAQNNRPSD